MLKNLLIAVSCHAKTGCHKRINIFLIQKIYLLIPEEVQINYWGKCKIPYTAANIGINNRTAIHVGQNNVPLIVCYLPAHDMQVNFFNNVCTGKKFFFGLIYLNGVCFTLVILILAKCKHIRMCAWSKWYFPYWFSLCTSI